MAETLLGKGRKAIDLIADPGTFKEGYVDDREVCADIGPGAVIGTAEMDGKVITVISNDAMVRNPRFSVVYAGVIGMEEAYKMAMAVYATIEADRDKPLNQKRPLVLLVDTPGNGPGKLEEIFGMNKATGSYQLALAQAREEGHPVIAVVIGRAISGAFLCHGLQADRILALSEEFKTMIHVMPVTSISRITKMDIEVLNELSKTNPVFASGASYFYRLGGLNEVLTSINQIKPEVEEQIDDVRRANFSDLSEKNGPWGRGLLGEERQGRKMRKVVLNTMGEEFTKLEDEYL